MDINLEYLGEKEIDIYMEINLKKTTVVDVKELLDELYEQFLICIYDYESLLSKTKIN